MTRYSRPERIADGCVHVVGLLAGSGAGVTLALMVLARPDRLRAVGLGVYVFGLLAMLTCSALYHMSQDQRRKLLYRRLDHAAIFLMIAGTYTPFALLAISGPIGTYLLVFVWSVAAIGIVFKLMSPSRLEWLAITTYLLLGWTIVLAFEPLFAAVSAQGVLLLVIGGLLYSIGVVFHRWRRLPYHNVIWHGCVLAAAACHFVVILTNVAMTA